jgi:hypothetical protein
VNVRANLSSPRPRFCEKRVIVGHGIIKEGDINAMSREVEGTKWEKKKKKQKSKNSEFKSGNCEVE